MRIRKFNENNDMNRSLKDYIRGKIEYTKIINLMYKNMDIFDILGDYIYNDIFCGKIPKSLDYITKKDKLAILLISESDLIVDRLKELYGEPIYHNEFGEGFEGNYNQETDEYIEPENKSGFASYFINIEGVELHVGYDHRGLSLEVEKNIEIEKIYKSLKIYLLYLYL